MALPPEYWFSEGLSRAEIGGPNPISSIGLPWAMGKAALIERLGLGWHRIHLSQESRILGCLLSKMLPGSIGWTGLQHLGGCCKDPKPNVPVLPMKKRVPRLEPGRPALTFLCRTEGKTGLAGVVWPHVETMATQFANPTLDS